MDTGMGMGWLMSSLVNGGITRSQPEDVAGGSTRRRFRRYRGARSATTIESPEAIEAEAPPVGEVIAVDLTDLAAEKVDHGRA